ncbi:hypothetical protein B0H14DRAFT_2556905 [Mycena olivaceomarginata]|nr:hypothetical protein B0H14DRAFT_2556905 [Mycena olivaceomarginata]
MLIFALIERLLRTWRAFAEVRQIHILCTFFGQCLKARTVNDIDKALLDYHQPQHPKAPPTEFAINREYLTSMHNPAGRMYYYVLAEDGSGIGSEVLLFPRATDLLEVLRQQWGPDIKGIIKHLLARGIPFWLAYRSLQIMPDPSPRVSKQIPLRV